MSEKQSKFAYALERLIDKNNNEDFFKYAWREKVKNLYEAESKYEHLLNYMNEQITSNFILINAFNPADKFDTYSKSMFKDYLKACQDLAFLYNMKTIIIDDFCTTEMRDNVEYTICKYYGLRYNKDLLGYFKDGDGK